MTQIRLTEYSQIATTKFALADIGNGLPPPPRPALVSAFSHSMAQIIDIPVPSLTYEDLNQAIWDAVQKKTPHRFLNVNIHAINLCFQNPEFYAALLDAELVFCDGEGVRQVLKRQEPAFSPRITYADWMPDFLPFATKKGLRLFYYGSTQDIVEKAADESRRQNPGLQIVGAYHGFTEDLSEALHELKPDVLIVGRGMPRQELWIEKHFRNLPPMVYLAGGAVFDYLAGSIPRAPRFMCDFGLEWLFRLFYEPRRMFVRYAVGNPLFAFRMFLGQKPEKSWRRSG